MIVTEYSNNLNNCTAEKKQENNNLSSTLYSLYQGSQTQTTLRAAWGLKQELESRTMKR